MAGRTIRVLGLDPGSQKAGYGVVDRTSSRIVHVDNGLLMAPPRAPVEERLLEIHDRLVEILDRFRPDVIAIEAVFSRLDPRAALVLGQARGVMLLAAARTGAVVETYEASKVKKTVTGNGRATKHQIQQMVKTVLGLPEPPAEDAADALALSICHCQHAKGAAVRDRIAARPRR